jgi:sigma-B regulation protein RsbU (phosphoserine phosphatase)
MIRCFSEEIRDPADLLNKLSTRLGQDSKEDLFATILALQIKASEPEVKYANAGHASPIINRPRSGFAEIQEGEAGVPLGLFNSIPDPYANQTIHLLPGDGIFLYTDGITEPTESRPERLSTESMKRTLESLPELSAAETLENFTGQLFFDNNLLNEPAEDETGIYLKLE